MPNPNELKITTQQEDKDCCNCKALRNTLLASAAAAATATVIFYSIKKYRRKKIEKELFAYEIWG